MGYVQEQAVKLPEANWHHILQANERGSLGCGEYEYENWEHQDFEIGDLSATQDNEDG